MGLDSNEQLEHIYKLTRENNKMLRAMRRNAFIGGILRLIIWALAIGVPIWFYITYVHPVLQSAINTVEEVQRTGQEVGMRFEGLSELLDSFPSFLQPSTEAAE